MYMAPITSQRPSIHALPHFFVDCRVHLFQLFVEIWLAVTEPIVRVLAHEAEHVGDGAAVFAKSLLDRPEIDDVEMGVGVDVDRALGAIGSAFKNMFRVDDVERGLRLRLPPPDQ